MAYVQGLLARRGARLGPPDMSQFVIDLESGPEPQASQDGPEQ